MDWAFEFAPPMPPQLVATLGGLARHADKKGRGAYPAVPRLAAYTCKSERSVQRDLAELRKLGLIRLGDQSKANHLPEGKRPEVYDLAMERTVPNGRAGRDEVTRTSLVTLTSSRARGGRKKPSSDAMTSDLTGDVDVRGDVDVTGDVGVADGVTWASQRGDVGVTQTKEMNQLPEPEDNYFFAAAEMNDAADVLDAIAAKSEEIHKQRGGPDLSAFVAFWNAYPRKKSMGKAKDAWRLALDDGADPDVIVAAATAYAFERANEDARFTPYPARWLEEGRYLDEPDPAPPPNSQDPGGHQPYRNPEDQDLYDEPFYPPRSS